MIESRRIRFAHGRAKMFFLDVHAKAGPCREGLVAVGAGQHQIIQMIGLNMVLEVGAAVKGVGLLADLALPHHRPVLSQHTSHVALEDGVQPAYGEEGGQPGVRRWIR